MTSVLDPHTEEEWRKSILVAWKKWGTGKPLDSRAVDYLAQQFATSLQLPTPNILSASQYNGCYILDANGEAQLEPDVMKWAEWMEKGNRQVALNFVNGVRVSTVFMGLDHSFGFGSPVLWETMIFGSNIEDLINYQERYISKEDALKGHAEAVALVQKLTSSKNMRQ